MLTAKGIATDGCSYLWLAEDIVKGDFENGINAFLPPLFPILSASFSFLFSDLELSGRMVSCILGSLTVFPLFFLVKDIFDKRVAFVTVIFYIVHPYLLRASGEVLTEATYFFLITSLAWILWVAIKKKKWFLFLLAGLISFLIFLARPEGIAVIFLVLCWILLPGLKRLKKEFNWKLIAIFCILVAYILPLFLFYLHIKDDIEGMRLTSRRIAFVDDKGQDESWVQLANRVMKSRIERSFPDIFLAIPKAYYPPFLALALFGLVKRRKSKAFRKGEGFILSFLVLRILVMILFGGITDRYFYAFVPIALGWAGVGFWEINDQFLAKVRAKRYKWAGEMISQFSIVILLVIFALCLPKGLKPIRQNREIQKKAGLWLKENAGMQNFTVLANGKQEAFHAGAEFYSLPKGTYKDVLGQARNIDADFIIIDKHIQDICPGFQSMAKDEDLEVFTSKFVNSNRNILIYKVKK